MWQKIMANRFLDYIYKLAKLIGKSSEIQTHNYRQLQTIIDVKQNETQHINTIIAKKQHKNTKILTTKKHKNRYKQHSTIIAIYRERKQQQKSQKKS